MHIKKLYSEIRCMGPYKAAVSCVKQTLEFSKLDIYIEFMLKYLNRDIKIWLYYLAFQSYKGVY